MELSTATVISVNGSTEAIELVFNAEDDTDVSEARYQSTELFQNSITYSFFYTNHNKQSDNKSLYEDILEESKKKIQGL